MTHSNHDDAPALVLTDDELVALAHEHSTAWPTELPTVDLDDAEALRMALRRGRRSLVARELFVVDTVADHIEVTESPALESVTACLTNWPYRTRMSLLDVDGDLATFDLLSYAYPQDADTWLVESVNASGSHRFVHVRGDELAEFYSFMLDVVVAQGVPATGSAAALRIAIGTPESSAAAVTATHGRLNVIKVEDHVLEEIDCDTAGGAWSTACRLVGAHMGSG